MRLPGLWPRWAMGIGCAGALGSALPAGAAPEFLEPQRAFALSARAQDASTLELRFKVASGYYLYAESLRVSARDAVLGELVVPAGRIKYDETFKKKLEVHRGELVMRLPVKNAPPHFVLDVKSQGCADAGLCYPPQARSVSASLAAFGGTGRVDVEPLRPR